MTTAYLEQLEQLREINARQRDFWKQALEIVTRPRVPFVAYDLLTRECVVIVDRHSANVWRMDDGGLIDEGDWTTAPPPHAYREFLEAKRDLELHGPRNQDDRDEHDNSAPADVQ